MKSSVLPAKAGIGLPLPRRNNPFDWPPVKHIVGGGQDYSRYGRQQDIESLGGFRMALFWTPDDCLVLTGLVVTGVSYWLMFRTVR